MLWELAIRIYLQREMVQTGRHFAAVMRHVFTYGNTHGYHCSNKMNIAAKSSSSNLYPRVFMTWSFLRKSLSLASCCHATDSQPAMNPFDIFLAVDQACKSPTDPRYSSHISV